MYKVLRGMEEKGYVQIIEGEPTHFVCLRPDKLISRIRADFMLSLNETFYGLNALSLEKQVPDFENPAEIELTC